MDSQLDSTNSKLETSKSNNEENTMSLFGGKDISEVSDNPFEIAPGTYHGIVTDVKVTQKEGSPYPSLLIRWGIDQPESEFHGKPLKASFGLPLADGQRTYDQLDSKEKDMLKFLKRHLIRGLDLSETEVNKLGDEYPLTNLIGKRAYLTTVVRNGFNNIQDALSVRLFNEERDPSENGGVSVSSSSDFGL